MPYTFQGDTYLVPRNYVAYCEYYFGKDWMTPIRKFDFNKSRMQILKEYSVQYVKALLPVGFVERIQKRGDKVILDKWLSKIYKK